ncbi:PLP-dependent aminotransferase family protein [Aliiruegeria lutimaris]|uniref:Transcriptional regulator, GntR family n=1 Tax=Aliiruegeria lutimaris TaxID=571298 RepID=A0A1G8TB68_9RHOB|nr:PLP-dependent aminotransferase family protein [Aliiruegeria lutimaris]SDJ37920.1 transcriptional regulator, GntR family [Aliiruegeria lutimaris]
MSVPVESIFLDRDSGRTLQQQLQKAISDAILAGRFVPGERMPSTRNLARHLGVARITVALAYTELVANDYLTARGRSGYYVSPSAPRLPSFEPAVQDSAEGPDWSRAIANSCSAPLAVYRPPDWRSYRFPFIYGQCDPKLFDHGNWRQCALQALGRTDIESLTTDYYERDDPVLVEFILRKILPRRGIVARPEQILLTMGAQNALWTAAQILLSSDRKAAMENPCYPGLRDILLKTRCDLVPVDVDGQGLPPEALPQGVDVVFTTASDQCPTNVTMPLARRKALLERAAREGFVIVEDDYEFEMSFLDAPSPALKSLDQTGRVIHVGSFSKSLFPGLRLGYIVAAEPFIRHARALRGTVLRHPPGHIQRTVAYFLSLGHFETQIARMNRRYRKRRAIMEQALQEQELEIVNRSALGGSSFWMRAPEGVDTSELARRLREEQVLIEPGEAFFSPEQGERRHFRLAYSSISSSRIPEGIERLARALRAAEVKRS